MRYFEDTFLFLLSGISLFSVFYFLEQFLDFFQWYPITVEYFCPDDEQTGLPTLCDIPHDMIINEEKKKILELVYHSIANTFLLNMLLIRVLIINSKLSK